MLEAEQVKWDQALHLVELHRATGATFVGTAEYLCLTCIPASAVTKLWHWKEFKEYCGVEGYRPDFAS